MGADFEYIAVLGRDAIAVPVSGGQLELTASAVVVLGSLVTVSGSVGRDAAVQTSVVFADVVQAEPASDGAIVAFLGGVDGTFGGAFGELSFMSIIYTNAGER